EVRAQERQDLELAKTVPSTEKAKELWAQYLKFGEAELLLFEHRANTELRRRRMRHAQEALVAESGARAGNAMRARALLKFEAALAGEVPRAELKGLMGIYPHVLAQHLLTRDGIELGPHFVVRTLFKARWNRLCDLPPETDLSPVERRAYFGWMGLHAANLSVRDRLQALVSYAAAGGAEAEQALGVLAFVDQDYRRAAASFERAYTQTSNLRLRNYLRGAHVAAGQLGGPASANAAQAAGANN
ncbi:MAG TPA: hypothetical protein VMF89_03230, partial [Polyangiales bacterium]|nr:hypothetical protein [Polyangiales bacterium]